MASGHVNRTNRPNTWLHRPACGREESPCQLGAVHTWHKAAGGNVRFRAAVGAITDVTRRLFYQPCFATRLGGVSGGRETQGWRDSSHTAMVGAGKLGSAKLPMATATYPGKPSPSQ
jgi:hypothetical protein